MRSLWPPRYFVAEWMTTSTPNSSGRWLYGVANVASTTVFTRCRRPIAAKRSMSRMRLCGLVGDSRDEHARRRADGVLERLVVARRHRRHLDAVAVQRLVQELPRPAIAVVGDDDVRAARQHREQRGGDRRHAAREQETRLGALERGELVLRDPLRRVAVAAVLDAVDPALEVVLQLLRVGERVGGRLHDRRRQRVARLRPRLAAVHRERARARSARGRLSGAGTSRPLPLARAHVRTPGGAPARRDARWRGRPGRDRRAARRACSGTSA